MCLRPQSAGSTIPRLRPTGSSLGIAPVDYDPVVLLKPFGPRLAAGALPSRASSMVAPGRPIRVPAFAVVPHEPLHTFHPLWPVRRYPHLRISVRGPGPSGTSTHLTRQLPGTHYGRVRLRHVDVAHADAARRRGASDFLGVRWCRGCDELPPSSRLRGSERGFWHLCHSQFLTDVPHHPCRCLVAVDHTAIRQSVCTLAQALLPDLARHGTGLARLMLAGIDKHDPASSFFRFDAQV